MTENITLFDTVAVKYVQADIQLFDPPMCCSTGLCGPTIDQTLLDMNEIVLKLKETGITVERYQMSGNPNAFIGNLDVMRLVREKQMDALPITVIHGKVIKVGAYPTLAEIETALGQGHQS
jgi:hypothetical protein